MALRCSDEKNHNHFVTLPYMRLAARPWSNSAVIVSLLTAATTWKSRLLVLRYFAARSSRAKFAALGGPTEDGGIALRDLCQPLLVTAESGGLATYYEIITRGVYTPYSDWEPSSNQTVVDVGANIGVFALWAASRVGAAGTVIALEPNPTAFRILNRNLGGLDQASTHAVACGDAPSTMDLHYAHGRLSIGSFHERPDRTETVAVPVECLDDLLAELDGPVDLLEIDVEGFEAPVLRGAAKTLQRTRRLALEIAGSDFEESRALIESAGLTLVNTDDGMWNIPREAAMVAHFERQ